MSESLLAKALKAVHGARVETMTELRVLVDLEVEGPQTISEIARGLKLPMSTASRVLYGLVQAELVNYTEVKEDRRKRYVALSPLGLRLIRDL